MRGSVRGVGGARRGTRSLIALVLVVVMVPLVLIVGATGADAATATITSTGPLTSVGVSDQLNCSVNHTGDTSGEFFGDTACGTFIVVDGTMYFSPATIPAGQPSATPFTAVNQTGPTGSGTEADPFKIVTTVTAGTTGVGITETDTYVTGLESYRTDVQLTNSSGTAKSVRVYRAADCFLQSSDTGFGAVDTASGAVACTTGLDPGSRIEQWFPLTAGSSYLESGYSTVWSTIASMQPFPNTCTCATNLDNGAGLSWDVSVPASGSTTVSSLITFSPLGRLPLSLDKTADAGSVAPGGTDGYTITATNPNAVAVPLDTLVDDLPAGFGYTAGSTSGATTANPTISGQQLTWTGISVPGNGTASIHFGVTASSTPGTYANQASGTATDYTVAPTGPTASVTVTGTVSPLVLGLTPASATNPVGTAHTVTATATRDSAPQSGVGVTFSVVSGPNAGTTGSGTTNGSGEATFTYTGSATPGTDTIRASALDGETTVTSNDVTKTWTPTAAGTLVISSTTEPAVVTAGGQALDTVTASNTGTSALDRGRRHAHAPDRHDVELDHSEPRDVRRADRQHRDLPPRHHRQRRERDDPRGHPGAGDATAGGHGHDDRERHVDRDRARDTGVVLDAGPDRNPGPGLGLRAAGRDARDRHHRDAGGQHDHQLHVAELGARRPDLAAGREPSVAHVLRRPALQREDGLREPVHRLRQPAPAAEAQDHVGPYGGRPRHLLHALRAEVAGRSERARARLRGATPLRPPPPRAQLLAVLVVLVAAPPA